MRCDIISIFPEYLEPLKLSLPGQAQRKGLLDVAVHDLRDFAHDRHRTVDDTPYGGGAGMVMKPQPWWEALEHVRTLGDGTPTLIVPGPGGEVLTQRLARELADEDWLIFACGRYEGIDERVYEAAADVMPVRVISLGDYVLNGGEVAVLAMIEAAARLLPGFMGNAESLVEESHEDGLLEYPVYTKPATWQGREVPPVLLSGDHGKVAAWRHQQRLERTAARRPDLLHASSALTPGGVDDRWGGALIAKATPADVGDLLTCTHACWLREGILNDTLTIPAQHETVESLTASLHEWDTYVLRHDGRFIGSVRGQLVDDTWHIGRLMVVPDLHGRGLGRALLEFIQEVAPSDATRFELFTGTGSEHNLKLYKKAGFRGVVQPNGATVVFTKRRRGR
ncbi:tRNA (guanosine(37)-N1)-methyltransferase TrmD [Dermacoccus nishinomiyaensis]|uniref:tRNA (guanosine(37)-N1)-methyltransferase TrmD n=1 Tax=Dermacoccus nishinomiyaensis TaxID=1274 RepID=UPI00093E7ACC|nr:tRNA (guanosine(37)-N1)-methyltransferase TrmD [Dermacoccus nishinomiyaensis]TJZ98607.1 tRNA (guanosine(37)-N1)-methyltransferase TrmD [Dermacoccus nishinomiyaensis]